MTDADDARPDPDALLAESRKEKRGTLKIFLGAAPGVGKTYEMLVGAQRKRAEGVDVVVGVVETHGRKDTLALLDGLEVLPRRRIEYKGRTLEELDLDGLLARRPALALIDELAHTNVEGSRHPKRHQDVEELLAAGIDVWSTLNVQHVESLNDVVARITRVRIRETVPDHVLDTADDVEVIDLPPNELIQRLEDGKVYRDVEAQRALKHYFKPGNLTALRELALRRTAERVDDQMRQYMQRHAIRGPWAASERLLVCIDETVAAAARVRRAKRVADRLDAPWFAVYVESARHHGLNPAQRARIDETLRLASSLGAESLTLPGSRRIAEDLLRYARDNNITQIIIGSSQRAWWFEWLHGSVVRDLVRHAAGIDVHVLASDKAESETPAESPTPPPPTAAAASPFDATLRSRLGAYGRSALMVAAATVLGHGVLAVADVPNVSLLFLAPVLWSASRDGLGPSLFAAASSALAYNFFFIEPRFSFSIADTAQVLAFAFFCIAAALTSTLTARERASTLTARAQARTTAELFAFSRKLAGIRKLETLAAATTAQIANMLTVDAVLLLPPAKGGPLAVAASAPANNALDEADRAAATWCWDKNQPTGRGTDTLPGARRLFLPLRTGQGQVGVIGVSRAASDFLLSPHERRLLDALADLAAIAAERIRLAKDVDQARMRSETDRLRAALLTSISHDLRTPLASIIGAISSLRSYGRHYDEAAREELLATAADEAERLNRYVANLLDMTRLDAGSVQPQLKPCDLADLVDAAVRRTARQLAGHTVKRILPASLPLLNLDAVLMEQVLANLLDNAAKYTPAGSVIEIVAERHRFSVMLSVRDNGPGIPAVDLQRVFDKFYRVRSPSDGARSGTGLGLAICRGFVEAMGGRIQARNRSDGPGAEFVIEFPPDAIADAPADSGSEAA